MYRMMYSAYLNIAKGLAFLGGVLFLLVTFGIFVETVIRFLGLGSIKGIVDFSEHSLFTMAILAAPWILICNGHISVSVFTDQFTGNVGLFFRALVQVIGCAVCSIISWYSYKVFLSSFFSDELIFQELVIPEWWLMWQVPIAFSLMTFEFARRLLSDFSFSEKQLELHDVES